MPVRSWILVLGALGAWGCGGGEAVLQGRALRADGSPAAGFELSLYEVPRSVRDQPCRYAPTLTSFGARPVQTVATGSDGVYRFLARMDPSSSRAGWAPCWLIAHPSNGVSGRTAGIALERPRAPVRAPDLRLWDARIETALEADALHLRWRPPEPSGAVAGEAVFTQHGQAFWKARVDPRNVGAIVAREVLEDVATPEVHLEAEWLSQDGDEGSVFHVHQASEPSTFPGGDRAPASRGGVCLYGGGSGRCALTDGAFRPVDVLSSVVEVALGSGIQARRMVIRSLVTDAEVLEVQGAAAGGAPQVLATVEPPSDFEVIDLEGSEPFSLYQLVAYRKDGTPAEIDLLGEVSLVE